MSAEEKRIAMLLGQDKVLEAKPGHDTHNRGLNILAYRSPETESLFEYYIDDLSNGVPIRIIKTFDRLIERMRCVAPLDAWREV